MTTKVKISAQNEELSRKIDYIRECSFNNNKTMFVQSVIDLTLWWSPKGHPILEQDLINILFEKLIVPNINAFSNDDKNKVFLFARSLALKLIETYEDPSLLLNPLSGKTYASDVQYNNFHSIRIYSIIYIGVLLNDDALIDWSKKHLLLQIDNNLNDDGTSFDLQHRDSLGYHVYNVRPLLKTCIVLKSIPKYSKDDFYNYKTKTDNSIKNAIHYLIPYVMGHKIHHMLINSHFQSDRNSKNYGAVWKKEDAKWLFCDACCFDGVVKEVYNAIWKK